METRGRLGGSHAVTGGEAGAMAGCGDAWWWLLLDPSVSVTEEAKQAAEREDTGPRVWTREALLSSGGGVVPAAGRRAAWAEPSLGAPFTHLALV